VQNVLQRLKVQTAGESHGRGMLATLTGVPAGLPFDTEFIDAFLARRQRGPGRSSRQRLEHDQVDVLAGVYRGKTSGAPVVLMVPNVDNSLAQRPPLHRPRPGHADLSGGQKYGSRDMRPILERASARETAARVAAGALAARALLEFEVELLGHVRCLGPVKCREPKVGADYERLRTRRDRSPFACLDRPAEQAMAKAVEQAASAGDTLGGVLEVRALGVPPGLGSLDGFGTRLDARLAGALMSIQAVKAVEGGDGVEAAGLPGSQVHDELAAPDEDGPRRRSNRAGGVEGGMSNGEELVVRAWMKPLSMLRTPLRSWDFEAGKASKAFFERSDVTAVPAASVVAEAMLALVVLDALLEKTGGDTLVEVRRNLSAHRRAVARRFGARPAR
jgi:chorismate synthase